MVVRRVLWALTGRAKLRKEKQVGEPEIKNATISSTMLGIEDHGIMTAFIHLDYGGSGQGFGGYGFDSLKVPGDYNSGRIGSVFGCEFIRRVLDVVGVEKWEDLKGKHIRVVSDWGKVYRIGNIIKDKWFDPQELADSLKEKVQS